MAPSFIGSLLDSIENSPALGTPLPSPMSGGLSVNPLRGTDSISPRLYNQSYNNSTPNTYVRNNRYSARHPSSLSKTIQRASKGVNGLDALPIELLQMIGRKLSHAEEAALALCSKSMLFKLGGDEVLKRVTCEAPEVFAWNSRGTGMQLEHRHELSNQKAQRMALLALLLKDFRRPMKLCRFCQKLHKSEEKVIWPVDAEKSEYSNRGASLAYGLPHTYMQAVIAHWMVLVPFPQEDIDGYLQTWNPTYDSDYERNFEGYVIDGQFYLRIEHVMKLPSPITSEPPASFQNIKLCSITHCASLLRIREAGLKERLSCRLSHEVENEAVCEACEGVKRCEECYTDSEVEIRGVTGVKELVLTTWQVFGVGATPFQSKFSSVKGEDGNWRVRMLRAGFIKEVFNSARNDTMRDETLENDEGD